MKNERIRIYLEIARRFVSHDWEAKLVALVLAFLVWYIIKDVVGREKAREGYGPRPAMRN
jgi:hypothetical protein